MAYSSLRANEEKHILRLRKRDKLRPETKGRNDKAQDVTPKSRVSEKELICLVKRWDVTAE